MKFDFEDRRDRIADAAIIPSASLGVCAHLEEPPVACQCGYKGGIWTADGQFMICEMGVHKCQGSEMIPIPDDATLRAYARVMAAAPLMLAGLIAIRDGTIKGTVGGDDVVWFDQITTLHDFCDQLIAKATEPRP